MTELHDRLAALSPAKRGLLLQLAPGYPVFTISLGVRPRVPLDADALPGALRDLVARHVDPDLRSASSARPSPASRPTRHVHQLGRTGASFDS
jgi:hypothetical protein